MTGPISFIRAFLQNKGGYILGATIYTKIASFLITYCTILFLSKSDLGSLNYALTIVSFLMPFMGMGAFQGLLKYGAEARSQTDKKQLLNYTLSRGILFSLFIALILQLFSGSITINIPEATGLLRALSIQLISLLVLELCKSYYRLLYLNQIAARIDFIHYTTLLLLAPLSMYLFGTSGYVWTMAIVPLILSIGIIIQGNLITMNLINTSPSFSITEFWKYSSFVSLGAVASQLLYSIDIMSIANILKDSEMVAIYKTASIIPLSLLFVPISVMSTDFVKIASKRGDREFLKNYVFNYLKLFLIIGIVMLLTIYFLGDFIFSLFGDKYAGYEQLFQVFFIGLFGAFLFRVPFGNILSAIGKANWNAYTSIFILILNVVLNYFWVQQYGIWGAAYSTVLIMWISGILSFILFLKYWQKLPR